MAKVETYATRIARGVKLLDEKRPGWLDKVNVAKLKMNHPIPTKTGCGCVLAQDFGDYFVGRESLDLDFYQAVDHGFVINGEDGQSTTDKYYRLTKAWKAAITRLRAERAK